MPTLFVGSHVRTLTTNSVHTSISPIVNSSVLHRLFRCPRAECVKTMSPSTLLQHLLADHRELRPRDLHPGTQIILDVADYLKDFEEMDSNAIGLIQIQGTTMNEVPLLVNACCILDKSHSKEYNKSKSRQDPKSGQWVCLWLSSVCNFDNWFSMRLFNKENPQTSMTKICKPVLVQHPMTTIDILEDLNVMLVEHSTISSICHTDERLKMEVTMYET
uniref:Uncharacterized protein n=1 Tax=Lygus hesperus TaxID=30085 RepID=A0A0A9WW81_LYGHE